MKGLGFSKEWMMFDLAIVAALLVAVFLGPWWAFAIVVWIAGFERSRRGATGVVAPSLLAAGTWLVVAFVRDAINGFRISQRIGGFFGLPSGSLLLVVVFVLAFVLALLASASGSQLGRIVRTSQTAR